MTEHTYIAIDLKSFYASAECADRRLDPLTTNLVVADASRTEKTICLAVSPALKACGIPGRPRLFEVVQKVRDINRLRLQAAPGRQFRGRSCSETELKHNRSLELDYITAVPRMGRYMEISAKIYGIYLRYLAPEDIHVYSIDEVFMDVSNYLRLYKLTARELAMKMIREVLRTTGITATAGIGSNLYLAKIAMDIEAKHIPPDRDGVRIAELDEVSFREKLWDHRPLTDFWRIGRGYAEKLASHGMNTMGDVARMSLQYEDLLYHLFGVNAELLIDHAWGYEPVTIRDIKACRPAEKSVSSGQVLQEPYDFAKGKLVAEEMADQLALDLTEKRLVTNRVGLGIGYDTANLADADRRKEYKGAVRINHYGKLVPKEAHGTEDLKRYTASMRLITGAAAAIFDRVVDPGLLIRRITVSAAHVLDEREIPAEKQEQGDLFTDYGAAEKQEAEENADLAREKRLQTAMLDIRKKLGKNAVLKGMNLKEGATGKMRNEQIGGHRK